MSTPGSLPTVPGADQRSDATVPTPSGRTSSDNSGARQVGCELEVAVTQEATIAIQVATAGHSDGRLPGEEHLRITVDGATLAMPVVEATERGRIHVATVPPGTLALSYTATVEPDDEGPTTPIDDLERLTYLRPSRYCPSDKLSGWATDEFGHLRGERARTEAVVTWIAARIRYVSGSSTGLDDAVDTLLAARGVCRDFAHLAVALCRALDVPARMVAVYAPGLAPMDFHAVVEVLLDGRWCVFDPTGLAPRSSLVRIATGRDAADTAFLTVLGGLAELRWTSVSAITTGALPIDDISRLVHLG